MLPSTRWPLIKHRAKLRLEHININEIDQSNHCEQY